MIGTIVLWLLAAAGPLATLLLARNVWRSWRLERRGLRADGSIVGSKSQPKTGLGAPWHYAVVEYRLPDGKRERFISETAELPEAIRVGAHVPVVYLDAPGGRAIAEINLFSHLWSDNARLAFVTAGLLGFTGLMIYIALAR